MNTFFQITALLIQIFTFLGHIVVRKIASLKQLSGIGRVGLVTSIFLIITLISKEIIVFNEEVLVVIAFFGFMVFLQSKISDMIYIELVSRNEKIYREADLNLFYHQKIINIILDLYKTASYVQNKLKNEYIFFRHTFLTNLWPCKAIDYVNNNLINIERNFSILYTEQKTIYQNIQNEQNAYNYALLQNLSKVYMN